MQQNLFWAAIYNLIAIPTAALRSVLDRVHKHGGGC
jgi:cation transport ATPase